MWHSRIGVWLWRISLCPSRIWCFFTGHGEVPGERWSYEPDYCPRCYVDWPQDRRELPKYFNRAYCWMVNQNWRWFIRLDDWLLEKHANRLPCWWEY